MSMNDKLDQVLERHKAVSESLASGSLEPTEITSLSKELSQLEPIARGIGELRTVETSLMEAEEILADPNADADMKELAQEEAIELKKALPDLEHALRILLIPKDEMDERNAIIEVRSGTGGDEAALFAGDLLRMYQRYAELKGWKFEMMSLSENELGGVKDASAAITGKDVFSRLKFESGVHRVQRVPATESQGRVHTSAATVAVLAEVEEVDVEMHANDLRVDYYRASGPGGQSVNTTDSAVRITHLPTGIVVQQQDEKSQHKNKAKALRILRARVYEYEQDKINAERAAERKQQIGSGDRSERIRTYNFPQGRLTDHRINLTLYKLDKVLEGSALDEVVDALVTEDQAAKLSEF